MRTTKQDASTYSYRALINLFIIISLSLLALTPVFAQKENLSISGTIKDEFEGLIIGAVIELSFPNGTKITIVSNERGEFRFNKLTLGKFKIGVSAEGFANYQDDYEITKTSINNLEIKLFPKIEEKVDVDVNSDVNLLTTEQLAGTQVLKEKDIEELPDDPLEFAERLQNLATSAGGIPGGAVVTVDGFLENGYLPSKTAIREVRINPNLFSAEYDFPPYRGGRIEIKTKPGADSFKGSTFFNFNNQYFNARNPLARERADIQRKQYGFTLGSPIIKNRTGFFANFERRDIDEFSTVNAVTLDENLETANFVSNVPKPQNLLISSIRNDWQLSKNHTLGVRYAFNRQKNENLGIGGLNLSERAYDYEKSEHSIRTSATSIINSKTVNELRVGLTFDKTERNAISDEQIINIAGAFSSGGAELQRLSNKKTTLEIGNNLITSFGNHTLKIGTQIFNYRTDNYQIANQNGTFLFGGTQISDGGSTESISGLEQYRRTLLGLPGGIPTQFSVLLGESDVSVNQWTFAAYIQDEWRLNKKMQVGLGLRAETQTSPLDSIRFAPRLSFAYSPDKKQRWVIRARAGIFYERIRDVLALETERLNGTNQQQILIANPSFTNPFLSGTNANPVTVRRIFDPNLRSPGSLQMRVELERVFGKGWKISSNYSWTKGWSQLRSRNINAPLISAKNPNPQTAPRPFGVPENILQFESSGKLEGNVLYVGVHQNSNKYFSLNAGYLNFDFKTDADGAFSFPQNSYDLSNEWAAPFWQNRHYMFASFTANLPWKLKFSTFANAKSGNAFNITTGQDNNGDGIFNDRPNLISNAEGQTIQTPFGNLDPNVINGNLERNIGTSPANFTLSTNISRTFIFGKKENDESRQYRLTTNIRVSNLLNRTNLSGLNGVLNSPFFNRAYAAGDARRITLGLRFNF